MTPPTCGICNIEKPHGVMVGSKFVCDSCNPWQRCDKCLGLVFAQPTPEQLDKHVCSKCGDVSNR